MVSANEEVRVEKAGAWSAVFSMALCVAVLIASEFMPVSLLTPLAADLGVTEGQAGQAISISGLFAVATSLSIAHLTKRIDRKVLVVGLTVMLAVSGLIVTLAPNYAILMLGRALLGVAVGGFWALSTANIIRLLSEEDIPKGLAAINIANAISSTISAPLGSLLGDYVGWRGAFFLVVPLAILAASWQWISLPALPPRGKGQSNNVFRLLLRPQVALGMASVLFLFMGQFALFTYLRPYLETVVGYPVSALSLILLLMGLGSIAGSWGVTRVLHTHLYSTVTAIPLVLACIALALVACSSMPLPVALLLVAWGVFSSAAPVGWGTWLSRVLRKEAEAGGGLQVATIQFAITVGAAAGGLLFDASGWWSTFAFSATLLVGSSIFGYAAWSNSRSIAPVPT